MKKGIQPNYRTSQMESSNEIPKEKKPQSYSLQQPSHQLFPLQQMPPFLWPPYPYQGFHYRPNLYYPGRHSSQQKENTEGAQNRFVAHVEFDSHSFTGEGCTEQKARQNAAEKAVLFLKTQPEKESASSDESLLATTDVSPISLVYNTATKLGFQVAFDLVKTIGQAHIPTFVYRCTVTKADGKKLITEGNDHAKKLAKKNAAQQMLAEMGIQSTETSGEKGEIPLGEDEEAINSKTITFLFSLVHNMQLSSPFYKYSTLDCADQVSKDFASKHNLPSCKLYRVHCSITFTQSSPQPLNCQIKSVGMGQTAKMAKSIAAYICLVKMGFKPPDTCRSEDFGKFLHFSLSQNQLLHLQKNSKLEFTNVYQDFSTKNQILDQNRLSELQFNCRFLLFILYKFYFYLFNVRTKKHFSAMREKLKPLFLEFKENYPFGSCEDQSFELIEAHLDQLDLNKCFDHLRFFSRLLSETLLDFKNYVFASESYRDTKRIAIVSASCSQELSSECRFTLVKNNHVSFGIGSNPTDAIEVASKAMLKSLSRYAMKSKEEVLVEVLQDSSKTRSKPSSNQVASKKCLTLLFDICNSLYIRKPAFDTTDREEQFYTHCDLLLPLGTADSTLAKVKVIAVANSKRLSRTIASYLMLVNIGIPSYSRTAIADINIAGFEKYLQLSLKHNPNVSLQTEQPVIEVDETEIRRNIDFAFEILYNVYRSHLKNRKMKNPSNLMDSIESSWYEYHNHRQQLLDESELFDACSENIKTGIQNILDTLDRSKFWDHLQLLSKIISTQTYNLNKPQQPSSVIDFNCSISNAEWESPSGSTFEPVIAFISIDCHSAGLCNSRLLKKPILGYGIGPDEVSAREMASYKSLRYLAIHLN